MVKIFDSELRVMEILWREGSLTAGQLARALKEQVSWNPNTTYTVIGKLVAKGAIERSETGFVCSALITRQQVQCQQAAELVTKLFDGSAQMFLSAFLRGNNPGADEIEGLRRLIDSLDSEVSE